MEIECGDCGDFVELTDKHYGDILRLHGLLPVRCSAEHGGRECLLMLESDRLRVLFMRSDQVETCELGSLGAEFPVGGLDVYGDSGWYNVITLLEFKGGKKLLTRRRITQFAQDKPGYFAWQAELLSKNAETLFGLFEQGREQTWKDEYLRFFKAQLKG